MFTPKNSSITLSDVGLTWPDGSVSLTGITGTFGAGRIGLVGANGSGKSTLLRLIAGELIPTTGHITTSGEVDYLPQSLPLGTDATVAELLGIAEKVSALRAIESGDVAERHFDALGTDWDVETRADAALRPIGLAAADLDRSLGEVSGGEAVLIAIAGLRMRAAPITLLDEPTNNLDRTSRAMLAELVTGWPGTLVVVSHDTALLELMEDTAELYAGRLCLFGGPYSQWRAHLDQEQAAAQQAARAAKQVVKTERRQRIEAETKLAGRAHTAKKNRENNRAPKIVMNQLRSNAEVSAGKLRTEAADKIRAAQAARDAAEARVRDAEHIHLELPDPDVPHGRRIAELHGTNRSFIVQGPERVAVIGRNGVGKTTLLENLIHGLPAEPGRAGGQLFTNRVGYLSQRLDGLDERASALDNVRGAAPAIPPGELRNRLARLLLRGDSVYRAVSTLSGGERFRVALARLLFADPPAQLLVLDEPTNNLDIRSVDQLVEALSGYRGALLVVSHDDAFLGRLGPDAVVTLHKSGALTDDPDAARETDA